MARDFGRDETAVSRIAEATARLIHSRWSHLLEWDAFAARVLPRLDEFADALSAKGSPPVMNIFGFIDGTFRLESHWQLMTCGSHIGRPRRGGQRGAVQRAVYSGHQVHFEQIIFLLLCLERVPTV
jgi:hypothetical protein